MINVHKIRTGSRMAGLALCLSVLAGSVHATNYHVKTNGSDGADGLSWATAFATIGRAITVSANGDVVDVNEGTYTERINYGGKQIHIRSLDPNDAAVVEATILNGNSTTLNTVTFSTSENSSAILDGITIRGGKYGVYCSGSSCTPRILHCVIRNNSSYGVYTAGSSSPTIHDCEIRQNGSYGLYLYGGSALISRCRILANVYYGVYAYQSYAGTINNCVIAKNSSSGVSFSNCPLASVINCTVTNHASMGINGTCAQVKNCIVWGNGNDLNSCTATYSCIEDQDAGTGNIHAHPMFMDEANDDYRLWYISPCIDAGDPASAYANEPNGGGGRIDMGAYGNTAEAASTVDTDADGLDDRWETTYWPTDDPNLHDPNDDSDGDGLRNKDEYYVHWDPTSDDSTSITGLVHNERLDVHYPSISLALTSADNGDTLTLATSTFVERINFAGKPLRLRSADPNDPAVVAATILNGNSTSLDTVTFNTGETANSILDGITILGGRYGVNCASSSSPKISKCILRNNSSNGAYVPNGCNPMFIDCLMTDNTGSGVFLGSGTSSLTRCRVFSNGYYGIYLGSNYAGTVQNCVIAGNSNRGIQSSNGGNILNCTIVGNSGGIGGTCTQITNCIVWGNGDDLTSVSCTPTYCCIEDQDAGTGNIHAHPMFMDEANDDYRLWYISPCIDAGDPASAYANEPNGGGGRIDMGAYGNTAEAASTVDTDADGLDDRWETTYWPTDDPNLHDPNDDSDGDGLRNKDEYYVHWDPNSDDSDLYDGVVSNSRIDVNFPSISLALSMAENGDTLVLDQRTYYEAIDFNGKPLHLRSADPNDPNIMAATIIDANNTSLDVVTFKTGETSASIIDGVTIRGGNDGIYCYGVTCVPRIMHCVIYGNAYMGVNIDNWSSPVISDCTSRNNTQYGFSVAGLYASCHATRTQILSNGSYGVRCYEGRVFLDQCVVARNTGRGVMLQSGNAGESSITNCTIYANNGGIDTVNVGAFGAVKNCIVWGNGDDLFACTATYSCIEDQDAGEGNIHAHPMFVDEPNDDYRLWYASPCIDAGDPCSVYADEPNGGGGRIDMGAYGNTADATTIVDADADGLDDTWETTYWPGDDPNLHGPNDDPDGDGLRNKDEYYAHWDPHASHAGRYDGLVYNGRIDVYYPSISLALATAFNGDTLIVAPSRFYETITFNNKPLWLRSTDPNDPNIVAATIIDANNTSLDAVVFSQGESTNSILDGITITGGKYGVRCTGSSPTLTNCVIRNNASSGVYCSGTSSPAIDNCSSIDNDGYGLYLESSSRTVSGLHIIGNTSYGVYLLHGSGTLKNCVIAKNSGYGIWSNQSPNAKVLNCTIAGNASYGIVGACSQIANCIIWNNGDDLSSGTATYSCIEDGDAGLGNFSADPCFVNVDANDFHLSPASVCIDTGEPWADYANEPAPSGGRINVGAYGNTAEAAATTDADGDGIADSWESHHWPGDDPNLHDPADDPDGDYFTNLSEFLYGYDPTQVTNQPMSLMHITLSASSFDPTLGQTFTTSYWLNMAGTVDTSFTSTATSEVVRVLPAAGTVGLNQAVWDGRDANDLIVLRGDYSIFIDANDGIGHDANSPAGTATLTYVHDITNLSISPLRIIATLDEITTFTYDINIDANMVVEVFDPCGVSYATPLDNVAQTQGSCEILWEGCTKPPDDPESRYPWCEGDYTVRVRFAGMREKDEETIAVFR